MTNKTHKNGNTTANSELIKALCLSLESVAKKYLLEQIIKRFKLDDPDSNLSEEDQQSIEYLTVCIPLMGWELAELDEDFDTSISKYLFKSDTDTEKESIVTFLIKQGVVAPISLNLIVEVFPFENSKELFQRFLDFLPEGISVFEFIDSEELELIWLEIFAEWDEICGARRFGAL